MLNTPVDSSSGREVTRPRADAATLRAGIASDNGVAGTPVRERCGADPERSPENTRRDTMTETETETESTETSEPSETDKRRWPDEGRLRELLDEDLTYAEIAETVNEESDREWAVTEEAVAAAGREHDLIEDRRVGAKWKADDDLPLITNAQNEVLHPIPEELAEAIGLEGRESIRYEPVPADGGLGLAVELTAGPDVTGEQSNETKPRKHDEMRHHMAYYPKVLAHMMGLHDIAHNVSGSSSDGSTSVEDTALFEAAGAGPSDDETDTTDEYDATVRLEQVGGGEHTLRAEFSEVVEPWVPEPDASAVDLSPERRTLTPVPYSENQRDEWGIEEGSVAKYRLWLPDGYGEAYNLQSAADAETDSNRVTVGEGTTRVALRYGVQNGEVVLRLDMDPEPGLSELVYRKVGRKDSGRPDAGYSTEQFYLHPAKAALHSVGIARTGVDDRHVWLDPAPGSVTVTPETDY
jgi:hypothetical protein